MTLNDREMGFMKTAQIARMLALALLACAATMRAADPPIAENKEAEEGDGLVIGTRDPKVFNEIDRFILARLRSESVDPSPICTDYEFVRRAFVDVVGMIPTGEEIKAFVNDKSAEKRAKLVEKLLNDNERYADHWEVMWGDWLREHTAGKKEAEPGKYRDWLRAALKSNMPYDQFAMKLMTASGKPSENAATNFFFRDQMNRVETVNTIAQTFMGTRMACAQCHDHPFDKWTQTDFHGLMAYFSQVQVTKAPKKKDVNQEEPHVADKPKGDYHMPMEGDDAKKGSKGGEIVEPRFAWNPALKPSGPTRREALASAVVAAPHFATVQVNRLWAQLMGRGIVEPTDDFREKNPPSHPELLDFLADQFVKNKFDSKHVLRLILNSAAYQRSSMPTDGNRSDLTLFSHQRVRRMTAEELFDSILVAAGHDKGLADMPGALADNNKTAAKKGNAPAMGRKKGHVEWATDLPTPAKTGTFMNVFNQPPRNVITTKRDEEGAVTQALEMLNGAAVNESVSSSPLIDHLAANKSDPRHAVTELYLATLTRAPSSAELEAAAKRSDGSRDSLVDLQWALMNTREFTFIK